VDQTSSPDKNQPVIVRAVTLELNPEHAEMLVKATQEGNVQMALRNPLEERPPEQPKTPSVEPPPKVARVAPHVTVIRGTLAERTKISSF
jgi:pilus assembly protein CpaB